MENWQEELYSQFNQTVENPEFPCIFAKQSLRNGTQKTVFYDETELSFLSLVQDLSDYIGNLKRVDIRERLFNPMLIFIKPRAFSSLKQYHELAWSLLQKIHDADSNPWPQEIPKEAENHLWSFCFNGVQLFINISAPLHKFHRSRNLGAGMVFVVNPSENIDYVAGNNPAGHKVRAKIRRRCERYDGVPLSPSLGFYSDEQNREWRQYQAIEPGGLEPKMCPLHIKT